MDSKKITKLINEANARPLDDFLGLSPNKIFRLLHGSLEDLEDICSLNISFKQEHLCDVPVVKEMLKLLQMVGEAGGAKATQNGFLPKKIVNAVFQLAHLDTDIGHISFQSEEHCSHVHALRNLIEITFPTDIAHSCGGTGSLSQGKSNPVPVPL